MRRLLYLLAVCFATSLVWSLWGCNSYSYAEQKKEEKKNIQDYIADNNIKVITQDEFLAKDSTTDVSKNEYVLFDETGVYMQIVRKGTGIRIKDGETKRVLCRFTEYDIENRDTTLTNMYLAGVVDEMLITNSSGTLSGYFTSGYMTNYYSETTVPEGWLIPLAYIRLDRYGNDSEVAKVRIIVPHSEGTTNASQYVTPYFYEIIYELGR